MDSDTRKEQEGYVLSKRSPHIRTAMLVGGHWKAPDGCRAICYSLDRAQLERIAASRGWAMPADGGGE